MDRDVVSDEVIEVAAKIDAATRRRVASLIVGGLDDGQISRALLLTQDEILAIKQTPEFLEEYSKSALEKAEDEIALDQGWDAIESEGVKKTLNNLKYNSDPLFALNAARVANQMKRRGSQQRVIDPSNRGQVIALQLNAQFVARYIGPKENGAIELRPRQTSGFERKSSDIPSPKRVSELLGIHKKKDEEERLTAGLVKLGDLT